MSASPEPQFESPDRPSRAAAAADADGADVDTEPARRGPSPREVVSAAAHLYLRPRSPSRAEPRAEPEPEPVVVGSPAERRCSTRALAADHPLPLTRAGTEGSLADPPAPPHKLRRPDLPAPPSSPPPTSLSAAAKLWQLLESAGLSQFQSALASEGYDDAAVLAMVEDSELREMGFRAGHVRKLRLLLAAEAPPETPAQPPPAPPGPAALPPPPAPFPPPPTPPAPAPPAPFPPPPRPPTLAESFAPAPSPDWPASPCVADPPVPVKPRPPAAPPRPPKVLSLEQPAASPDGIARALECHGDAVVALAADVANWRDEAAASVSQRGGGGAETLLIALRHLCYHLRQQEELRKLHSVLADGLLAHADAHAALPDRSDAAARLRSAASSLRSLRAVGLGGRPSTDGGDDALARRLADAVARDGEDGGGAADDDADPPAIDAVLTVLANCCERAPPRLGPLGAHGRGLGVVLRAVLRQRRMSAAKLVDAAEALRAERRLAADQLREAEEAHAADVLRLSREIDALERREQLLAQENRRLSASLHAARTPVPGSASPQQPRSSSALDRPGPRTEPPRLAAPTWPPPAAPPSLTVQARHQ
eukprot:TRINITY_DN729_c12_g1_i1.p1 TRINITY_DN729_c12_g1~~TRINITY_DN729_c12_g1_i1.p1  ORF type:complete len:621 (+),score=234.57 TRINITY_DN729_c12_g1_i1:78-1865(+)